MFAVKLLGILLFTGLAGCTSGQSLRAPGPFDANEIRVAERRVTAALTAPDATAWVNEYTEDAVLLESSSRPVSGRVELLELDLTRSRGHRIVTHGLPPERMTAPG